ncbi:hypothetical protein ACFWYW_47025 [Nonomuraea sp. NPDC059023]|uniref:hypothetical protein n=1 Tax=unclassified Nonomuraea TaxID=2593643 RepID=UPI003693845D
MIGMTHAIPVKPKRSKKARKARRRGTALRTYYRRDLGGQGDDTEVAADIIIDVLHTLADADWPDALARSLANGLEERHGPGYAVGLTITIDGLAAYPESW